MTFTRLPIIVLIAMILPPIPADAWQTPDDESSQATRRIEKEMLEKHDVYRKAAREIEQAMNMKDESGVVEKLRQTIKQFPVNSYQAMKIDALSGMIANETIDMELAKPQLEKIAKELSFQPAIEAAYPDGFPSPTPVGEIQFKSYPSYRMARTPLDGRPMDGDGSRSFFRLFNHIQSNDIAMTTPVEMTYTRDGEKLQPATMAFVYQNADIGETSEQGDVQVVDMDPIKVIAIGLRGSLDEQRIDQAVNELRQYSLKIPMKFTLKDQVRVMGYNGPSVPPADQFFEVQIELKENAKTSKSAPK